ncbi:cytochrome b5 reductase family protein [Aspergillus undulatus]|uniref:cytochrome b5 reductase family protein n=1 Tax=Aspergillus undulatus TaxID=1810928 RepID=UPI003CCD63F3
MYDYFPDTNKPDGAMSNILGCLPMGEEVDICGPAGEIVYKCSGIFIVSGNKQTFKRISVVLGGSGITPGYALLARILLTDGDDREIQVVDANKTPDDILLRSELDRFEKESKGDLVIVHVTNPGSEREGLTGHVNEEVLREHLLEPGEENVAILCEPLIMIEKAALPGLEASGYVRDENMHGL